MDMIIEFFTEYWLFIIGAIVFLFLFVKLIKLTVKLAIVVVIIIGIYMLVSNQPIPQNIDEAKEIVGELTSDVTGQVTKKVQDQTIERIANSVDGAEYTKDEEGSFTISYGDMTVTGNDDSEYVTISVNGQSYEMKKTEALKQVRFYMNQ
ncbi:hypothetical protein ACJ2A9_01910 [Anaerobacillus sp. MEB173]|uniref:hypothetical protein n=1 Tax=Anaerobacillus sp. MEB173 TaxID=3383345 RepID=UPI003F8F02B9